MTPTGSELKYVNDKLKFVGGTTIERLIHLNRTNFNFVFDILNWYEKMLRLFNEDQEIIGELTKVRVYGEMPLVKHFIDRHRLLSIRSNNRYDKYKYMIEKGANLSGMKFKTIHYSIKLLLIEYGVDEKNIIYYE